MEGPDLRYSYIILQIQPVSVNYSYILKTIHNTEGRCVIKILGETEEEQALILGVNCMTVDVNKFKKTLLKVFKNSSKKARSKAHSQHVYIHPFSSM